MGTFTDQVQGLVSEEKFKRQERKLEQAQKKEQEEAERDLYYILENAFTRNWNAKNNFNTKKDIYFYYSQHETKNKIIEKITKNTDVQYYLDKKYLSILKKIYTPYKQEEAKEQEKLRQKILYEKQQKQQKELKNQQLLDALCEIPFEKPKKTIPTSTILFILFLPFWCLYWLFKGLLKRKINRFFFLRLNI